MSPARMPMAVGNWKSSPARADVPELTRRLVQELSPLSGRGVELVLCPPFLWLTDVAELVAGAGILLGAQTIAATDGGGATGEIPASLLSGLCQYALVGHYERRILCGEREGDIRKKVQAALRSTVAPILCVGESADALDEGMGAAVVAEQLEADLDGLEVNDRLVIAYVPSWTTIGMVSPPPANYVNEICGVIRETVADMSSTDIATQVRVLYGGRLTESTVPELVTQREIDGLLIGAGATNAERFAAFAEAVAGSTSS